MTRGRPEPHLAQRAADRLGELGIVALQHLDRAQLDPAGRVDDEGRVHAAFLAQRAQPRRIDRRGAALVALHHPIHLEHGEDAVEQPGRRAERRQAHGTAPRARALAAVGSAADLGAASRPVELRAVREQAAGPAPLEECRLAGGRRLRAIGREELERPGLPPVDREAAGDFERAHGEPDEAHVQHDAREGALRGLERPVVGFDEVEAHARSGRWDDTALHPCRTAAAGGETRGRPVLAAEPSLLLVEDPLHRAEYAA
jgi:hypothetical protein